MVVFVAVGLAALVGAIYVACYICKGKEVKESKEWIPQTKWEIVPNKQTGGVTKQRWVSM